MWEIRKESSEEGGQQDGGKNVQRIPNNTKPFGQYKYYKCVYKSHSN